MTKSLVDLVREAGIVGAGGAGFPTHVKLKATVEYIVVNCAECEPLLRVDQQLITKRGKEIIQALKAVMTATQASKALIGLKKKYQEALAFLTDKLKNEPQIETVVLGDFYPAGDEQVLVYETTGRIVPEGGLPLNVGVVVLNVETLLNIYYALKGRGVTDKYVTITGWVAQPKTVKVPLGTSFQELLDLAGGPLGEDFMLINGGPMMGSLCQDLQTPVTKTTKGLVILPRQHSLVTKKNTDLSLIIKQAKAACCRCLQCTEVCPRYLLGHGLRPDEMMQTVSYGNYLGEKVTQAFLCCECGVCDLYQCPMGLSPRRVNMLIKKELAQAGIKNNRQGKPEKTRSMREYRRIPSKRLLARLNLTEYNGLAPLTEKLYKPKQVILPLRQHIGALAVACVQPGSRVAKGDLIALAPENALGAHLHASISGNVVQVDTAIVIEG